MNKETKILVTGGSGYIASFIIAKALDLGFAVNTTVRNLSRENEVRARLGKLSNKLDKITFFAADLNVDDGWAQAASGCEFVVHTASPFPEKNPKNADELIGPARDGAVRVLKAAYEAGVKRVVLTSSMAAISYGVDKDDTKERNESDWTNIDHDDAKHSAYILSKTIAERAAWDFVKDKPLELTTICPCAVLGPVLGSDFSTSIEIVKRLMQGAMPGLPRIGFQLVDVRDVADLHLAAMVSPKAAGERFIAANGFYWFAQIAQSLHDDLGNAARKVPTKTIPDFILKFAANFDPTIKSVLNEIGMVRNISNQKSKDLLNWQPRDAKISIRDTAHSLIREGLV